MPLENLNNPPTLIIMSGQGRRRSALPLQRQEVASTSAQTLAAIQDASEAGSKLGNSKCTTAQYEYRKRVFKQWTADNQIETGEQVNGAVLLHFMWDYVFTRPKNSRTKGFTSQAPSTTSVISLPILPNSNSSQHSAHPSNSNVSRLRNGSLAGRVCFEPESVRENGTPSTQLAGVAELEEEDIDDSDDESSDNDREMEDDGVETSVRSIRDGPDLAAYLQVTVNDNSSDEDEEDENEVPEGLMRDVNDRIIPIGADMSKKKRNSAAKKSAVHGKNRSNMDETLQKKGEKRRTAEKRRLQPDPSLTQVELDETLNNVVEKHGNLSAATTREERIQLGLERIRNCQLSPAAVKTWYYAIVSLWTEQSVTNSGTGHPWTKQWHNLFTALHRVTEQRRKEKHVDKMIDTIFEGYQTRNEIQQSYGYYFQKGTPEALRDMVSQSFGLYNLFRGDSQKMVTLSELAALVLEEEGPTKCVAIVAVSRAGKRNTKGLAQYGAMLRAKDVFACPVWALSAWLFVRFNILPNCPPSSQSSFPSFAERKDWYDLPLLSQVRDPTKPISYKTQQEAMINALLAAGVFPSKSTHENRRTGARLAEKGEVSIDDIARAGGWATATLETTYLSALPRKSMRVIAGHPKKKGFFVLPRAVVVPDTLKGQVFPEIKKMV